VSVDPAAAERQALRERRQAALSAFWGRGDKCAVCNERRWSIGDALALPLADQPAGAGYRYVPVTCASCGNTLLFHAGVLDATLAD
jgi:hypothetical protein